MVVDQIVCGECSQLMAELLPDDCIDLTITSPPYGNLRDYEGFTFDFGAIAAQLWRVTKPGGVVVWVVGDATVDGSETGTSFRQALEFMELGFRLHDTMIYAKHSLPFPAHVRYNQIFEYMFVFSKGGPKTFNPLTEKTKGYRPSPSSTTREAGGKTTRMKYEQGKSTRKRFNIWHYGAGYLKSTLDKMAFNHPAIFPEALARDHILSWSNPGDLVFDPMCGSGTTPKMAAELGRHYLGFDISEKYVELARRRVRGARIPLMGIDNRAFAL